MKKILLITVRSDEGGGPKHVAQILEHLNGEFEFYTACPYDPPYYEIYSQKSVSHFFLPHRKASLMKAFDLLFWCRDNKIDTIHTHGRGAAFYGFFLGAFGLKVIHTFHGVHSQSGLKGLFKKIFERFVYYFNHSHIFVSKSEYYEAVSLGFQNIQNSKIIPNGVDIASIQKKYHSLTQEESRRELNLPQGVKILGTLSRLDPHKQNVKLIEILIKLPKDHHLAIAGEGEEKDKLEAKVLELSLNSRVHFLGRISTPIKFLKAIDLYVSWSKGEGNPYSVLEAIACEKPLLLSKVTGHTEFKDDDILFSDSDEFIEKLNTSKPLKNYPHLSVIDCFELGIKSLY